MMVSRAIKDAMDSVSPADRWMHAYTYSAHPTCCAVALKNIDIIDRERLSENAEKMGARLHSGLLSAFSSHPNAGDIRGGKGLLAAVEFVEDRDTKKNFAGDFKFSPRLHAELMKRGVVTRTRPSGGAHPATGDILLFAPPLNVSEEQVDRLVEVTREAVTAVLSS
jgi:adenosylmethionine-8-amino-7-oxononanoate aminotransferase